MQLIKSSPITKQPPVELGFKVNLTLNYFANNNSDLASTIGEGANRSSISVDQFISLYLIPIICIVGVTLNILTFIVFTGCCNPRKARWFRSATYTFMSAIALADAGTLAVTAAIGYCRYFLAVL